jgi:hypothetical protein
MLKEPCLHECLSDNMKFIHEELIFKGLEVRNFSHSMKFR